MQLKRVLSATLWVVAFSGCTMNGGSIKSNPMQKFTSPEDLIIQQKLNQENGQAKAYVFDWGSQQRERTVESLIPRQNIGNYCQTMGGRLVLAHKSQLSLVKQARAKANLEKSPNVMQGIGAYRCLQQNKTLWLISIEPTAEISHQQRRSVSLLTQVMSEAEAKKFYQKTVAAKVTPAKKPTVDVKTPSIKTPEVATVETHQNPERHTDTPQQQQSRLYVNARRDINGGKNLVNACNSAQRAYNYGKLQGTEGTRVYTESGMLVARCLTEISAYRNRFPNAQGQAKRILQNLAHNYNHTAAKSMLARMK